MKQRYAVVVLFALIMTSSLVSLTSYRATEQLVAEDMNQALSKALDEQQSDMISADTIQVFNSYLKFEALKGKAYLAIDTKKGFQPRPQVSTATILSLSDQRPAMMLWTIALLWGLFCLYQHRRSVALGLWRFGFAAGTFHRCKRLRSETNPHAAATDGNVVAVAYPSALENGDLRCPMA